MRMFSDKGEQMHHFCITVCFADYAAFPYDQLGSGTFST